MKLQEIIQHLEHHAPLEYQESYDNSGLIVGHPDMDITGAIISLDATESVVDEAIEAGFNLIIAHHPIVFSGLKRFTGQNYVQRTIIKAIRNNIAIYAIHTNLDNVIDEGVNNKIAERIGLSRCEALLPHPGALIKDRPRGTGLIGWTQHPIEWTFFLEDLKQKMQVHVIRYTQPMKATIHKVAVCGGSGSFLLNQAIAMECDVFITSDFKYHEFFDANDKIMIADIGHYESEQFTINLIKDLIIKKISNFALRSTKVITNPINYL